MFVPRSPVGLGGGLWSVEHLLREMLGEGAETATSSITAEATPKTVR